MMGGPAAFVSDLEALGLLPERVGDLVVAHIVAPLGVAAGDTVAVAADPPGDYPRVPPHWVHLPERFDLLGGGRNASELGAGWSKWSRPHPGWQGGQSAAAEWVAHVRALLASASVA
jgi:hypothetical protein